MRVAIIGGGASGLATAWMLDEAHEVVLFEKQPILGGHIRTLGRNVPGDLPDGVFLDAGVIEFSRDNFPTFHRFMDALGVAMRPVPGTTSLFREGRTRIVSPAAIEHLGLGPLGRAAAYARLLPLAPARRRFLTRPDGDLYAQSLGEFLPRGALGAWLRLLTMYAYSIPYGEVDGLSAALCVPMLRDFQAPGQWTAVVGGTYAYVEALLDGLRARVHTSAPVDSVRRGDDVVVTVAGEAHPFDAVVFAAPPDRVLALLDDPTEAERRRFGAWRANHAHTLVHRDVGLYERRGTRHGTEFDVFERPGGRGGYNAVLNRLEGLPLDGPTYSLAYGLDDEIDPACVLLRQEHHTAHFSVEALRSRPDVIATNGERSTWHVGAWLGDGLHEGAIASALAVSRALGGRTV